MILYAILGLIFIAMVVLTVMSVKDWHWLNPVLLILIFIAGSAGMIGMAQTLHLRTEAQAKLASLTKRADTAEANQQMAVYGDVNSTEYGPESLRGVNQQVNLMMIGRGRTWEGGTVANNNGDIEFTFPVVQGAVETEDQNLENVELFAFAEGQLQIGPDNLPVAAPISFVGKFRVVQQSTTRLVLKPSIPIANFALYAQPATTWTLFERMPFDRHGVFREVEGITDETFDIATFRNILANKYFPAQSFSLDPNSKEYENLIDRFSFDGMSLGAINAYVESQPNRKSPRFEPTPEEVMVKYRFDATSNPYTVDDKSGKLDTDGTFTILGYAVDPTLHLSPGDETRDVVFNKDDTVIIDLQTAEGYERKDGTTVPPFTEREQVTELDRIYKRKLSDFPIEMANLFIRGERLADEADRFIQNNEVQDLTITDAESQKTERLRKSVAYQNDNKKLENDLDQVTALRQNLDQKVSQADQRIAQLEAMMLEVRQRIEALSAVKISTKP